MSIGKYLRQVLSRPFHERESLTAFARNCFLIALFVSVFLYIFKPFGFDRVESDAELLCLAFGVVTFVICMIYELVTRLVSGKGEGTVQTFGSWILYIMGLMSLIGLGNFFLNAYVNGGVYWSLLPMTIGNTVAIGSFPTIILGRIAMLRAEQKYQHISDQLNTQVKKPTSTVVSPTVRQLHGIDLSQIRYVEAVQNYVKIVYLTDDQKLESQLQRDTMKNVELECAESDLVRCHRSFMVHQPSIVSSTGNAQGLLLTLSDCADEIPVSRKYVLQFRQ